MKEIFKEWLSKDVDWIKVLTAFTLLISFMLIVNALIHITIPEQNKEILINVLGILEGALITLTSFYFGSSKGSEKKSEAIHEVMKSEAAVKEVEAKTDLQESKNKG